MTQSESQSYTGQSGHQMKTSQVAHLTGDFNVPSESGENNFDSFHLDDTTPPYGHYSVDSTQEFFSPGYNYQARGSTGSEMDFHSNQGHVSSQGMTPTSSGSSQIMMPQNVDNLQQTNGGKQFCASIIGRL